MEMEEKGSKIKGVLSELSSWRQSARRLALPDLDHIGMNTFRPKGSPAPATFSTPPKAQRPVDGGIPLPSHATPPPSRLLRQSQILERSLQATHHSKLLESCGQGTPQLQTLPVTHPPLPSAMDDNVRDEFHGRSTRRRGIRWEYLVDNSLLQRVLGSNCVGVLDLEVSRANRKGLQK